MKTSIIEVADMLSVLTVDEVEKRIDGVAGVESATVNFSAKNATVRYDETLLDVAEIKVLMHQRGQQSAGESKPKDDSASKSGHQSDDMPEPQHTEESMPSPDAPPVEAQGAKPSDAPPPPAAMP